MEKKPKAFTSSGENNSVNISHVGKYGKFIQVETLTNEDKSIVEHRNGGVYFNCDSYENDDMPSLENRLNALIKVEENMQTFIEAEIKKKSDELRRELGQKYNLRHIRLRIYHIQKEINTAKLDSSAASFCP